jgi:NAD(P)-dependent dehydrogenase (short-subunit alcohol dehydrogenase family)
MSRLAGKTALVTGATSGIGRALSTTLARTPAPILADPTSSTFAQRQKESTWL